MSETETRTVTVLEIMTDPDKDCVNNGDEVRISVTMSETETDPGRHKDTD